MTDEQHHIERVRDFMPMARKILGMTSGGHAVDANAVDLVAVALEVAWHMGKDDAANIEEPPAYAVLMQQGRVVSLDAERKTQAFVSGEPGPEWEPRAGSIIVMPRSLAPKMTTPGG